MTKQAEFLSILARSAARISTTQSLHELERAMLAAVNALGFQSFNLAIQKASAQEFMETPTLTTWATQDLLAYQRDRWAGRDPLLRQADGDGPPLLWRSDSWRSKGHHSYHEYLSSAGITAGATVPLGREGGQHGALTMLSFTERRHDPLLADTIYVLASLVVARCVGLGVVSRVDDRVMHLRLLSGHQREVLRWVAAGKTSTEIAVILGLSRRTVDYHVAETLRKLNVVNRAQAAAIYVGR